MSRLAGDMKGFVVLDVYRSTVKKQNKEKTLLWEVDVRGEYVQGVCGYIFYTDSVDRIRNSYLWS